MHALMYRAIQYPTAAQKPIVKKLGDLLRHVQKTIEAPTDPDYDYGINWLYPARKKQGYTFERQLHEFMSEAWTNPWLQYRLSKIKMPGTNALTAFVRYVARLLGFTETNALSEVMALGEELGMMGRSPGVNAQRKALVNQREYSPAYEEESQNPGTAVLQSAGERGLLGGEAGRAAPAPDAAAPARAEETATPGEVANPETGASDGARSSSRPTELIDLRKRRSILRSILECMQ
jgi:hypothetical protein